MKHLELYTPCRRIVFTLENCANLRAECVNLPQEVFNPNSLAARIIRTSLEKVTMDYRASSEPAPGNFPESLVFVLVTNRWSLDDRAGRPE